MRKLLDHRGVNNKSILNYGLRPTSRFLLQTSIQTTVTKTVDMIPFLCTDERLWDPIFLDYSEGNFTLFVSPPGAGKTFCLRGLVGELIEAGYHVVDVGSVDNDLYWSRYPLQSKFTNLLPPWRRQKSLPVKAYMPYYLRKRRTLKSGMKYGQIEIDDLEYQDITKNLFKQDESKPSAELVSSAWGETKPRSVDELVSRFGKVDTYNSLLALTGRKFAFNQVTVMTTGRKLLHLKESGFFGQEHRIDIVQDIKDGFLPVLCFQSERQMEMYHSVYIAGLIRKVFTAKIKGQLAGRLVFIFDDMGSLACPSRTNPSSKDVIMNDLIALGRKKGVYVIGAVQTVQQIPPEILAQVKNFVFFGKISGEDLDTIAKTMNVRPSIMRELLYRCPPRQLNDGRRSCILWSKSGLGIKGKPQEGWIPAPSSYHKEQD